MRSSAADRSSEPDNPDRQGWLGMRLGAALDLGRLPDVCGNRRGWYRGTATPSILRPSRSSRAREARSILVLMPLRARGVLLTLAICAWGSVAAPQGLGTSRYESMYGEPVDVTLF